MTKCVAQDMLSCEQFSQRGSPELVAWVGEDPDGTGWQPPPPYRVQNKCVHYYADYAADPDRQQDKCADLQPPVSYVDAPRGRASELIEPDIFARVQAQNSALPPQRINRQPVQ